MASMPLASRISQRAQNTYNLVLACASPMHTEISLNRRGARCPLHKHTLKCHGLRSGSRCAGNGQEGAQRQGTRVRRACVCMFMGRFKTQGADSHRLDAWRRTHGHLSAALAAGLVALRTTGPASPLTAIEPVRTTPGLAALTACGPAFGACGLAALATAGLCSDSYWVCCPRQPYSSHKHKTQQYLPALAVSTFPGHPEPASTRAVQNTPAQNKPSYKVDRMKPKNQSPDFSHAHFQQALLNSGSSSLGRWAAWLANLLPSSGDNHELGMYDGQGWFDPVLHSLLGWIALDVAPCKGPLQRYVTAQAAAT